MLNFFDAISKNEKIESIKGEGNAAAEEEETMYQASSGGVIYHHHAIIAFSSKSKSQKLISFNEWLRLTTFLSLNIKSNNC